MKGCEGRRQRCKKNAGFHRRRQTKVNWLMDTMVQEQPRHQMMVRHRFWEAGLFTTIVLTPFFLPFSNCSALPPDERLYHEDILNESAGCCSFGGLSVSKTPFFFCLEEDYKTTYLSDTKGDTFWSYFSFVSEITLSHSFQQSVKHSLQQRYTVASTEVIHHVE